MCKSVELESLNEAWEDLHSDRYVLTGILVKQNVLHAFTDRIEKLTDIKYKFDVKYDLLPQEPKSRIQIMMENRQKKREKMEHAAKSQVLLIYKSLHGHTRLGHWNSDDIN